MPHIQYTHSISLKRKQAKPSIGTVEQYTAEPQQIRQIQQKKPTTTQPNEMNEKQQQQQTKKKEEEFFSRAFFASVMFSGPVHFWPGPDRSNRT